jgi:hypothetical protein
MTKTIVLIALLISGAGRTACGQFVKKLVPGFVGVQHAGSIGWFAVGTGYELFSRRLRTGLQYGYVPPEKGGRLHIMSASIFLHPTSIRLGKQWSLNPVDVGIKGSYQFGKNYFFDLPSRYPPNYYWWKPALRLHLATETALRLKLPGNKRLRSVSAYLELNSNDLYLASFVLNTGSLSLADIVKAGAGLRFNFL